MMLHLLLILSFIRYSSAADAACTALEVKAADGKCYEKAEPAFPCVVAEQCTGGSSCLEVFDQSDYDGKVCSCPTGMIVTNAACVTGQCEATQVRLKDGSCMPLAPPNEFCVVNAQCQGGSVCTENICVCAAPKKLVGNECKADTAACGIYDVPTNDGGCVAQSTPGKACDAAVASICKDSTCTNGVCTCAAGQEAVNEKCVAVCAEGTKRDDKGVCQPVLVQPGEKCNPKDQCQDGSTCVNEICACPIGKTATNKKCECSAGTVADTAGKCVATVNPGGACDASIASICKDSTCTNSVCTCAEGNEAVNDKCVAKCAEGTKRDDKGVCQAVLVQPGEKCNPKDQCQGGSTCVQAVCACPEGKTVVEKVCQDKATACTAGTVPDAAGKCVPTVAPGDACDAAIASICQDTSNCINSVCTCPDGNEVVNKKCSAKCAEGTKRDDKGICKEVLVQPGEKCNPKDKCQGGSTCVNNVCACSQGQTVVDNKCQAGNGGGATGTDKRCLSTSTPINAPDGQIQGCFFLGLHDPICGGGVCTLNQVTKFGGVCCRFADESVRCPTGTTSVHKTNSYLQTCAFVNTADAICGTGGRCEKDPANDFGGVCCQGQKTVTTIDNSRCLSTQTAVAGSDGQVQTCLFVGQYDAVCQGGVCTQDQKNAFGGVCCKFTNPSDRCPAGKTPVNQANGQIQTCFFVNSNDFICAGGRCEPDPASTLGICCK